MARILFCLALGVALVAPAATSVRAADPPAADQNKSDEELFVGTWKLIRFNQDRIADNVENLSITLTFEPNTWKAVVVNDGGTQEFDGTYTIDAKQTPKIFDAAVRTAAESNPVYAIYELEGRTLKMRFRNDGGQRPPDFVTPVQESMLLVFRRE